MTTKQIEALKAAVKAHRVLWNPQPHIALVVADTAVEQSDDEPCAVFKDGTAVALYQCDLKDFVIITDIPE
jgi:hypothetical protein